MARGRVAVAIELSVFERGEFEGLTRRHKTARSLARRARIILAAAEGLRTRRLPNAWE